MTDTSSRKRQPRGTTTGGQFATEAKGESSVSLTQGKSEPDVRAPRTATELKKSLNNSRLTADTPRTVVLHSGLNASHAEFVGARAPGLLEIDHSGFTPVRIMSGYAHVNAVSPSGNSITAKDGSTVSVSVYRGVKTGVTAEAGSSVNVTSRIGPDSRTSVTWYEGASVRVNGEDLDFHAAARREDVMLHRIGRDKPGHPEHREYMESLIAEVVNPRTYQEAVGVLDGSDLQTGQRRRVGLGARFADQIDVTGSEAPFHLQVDAVDGANVRCTRKYASVNASGRGTTTTAQEGSIVNYRSQGTGHLLVIEDGASVSARAADLEGVDIVQHRNGGLYVDGELIRASQEWKNAPAGVASRMISS